MGRLWDLMVLNVLWLACCLPIFTAGASTLALHSVIREMQEDRDTALVRSFFHALRINLKRGLVAEGILAAAGVLIACSLRFWSQYGGPLGQLCMVIGIIAALFYVLVLICLFQTMIFTEYSVPRSIAVSFIAAAQNLPGTCLSILMVSSCAVLVLTVHLAALLFCCIGVSGLCCICMYLGPWRPGLSQKQSS